MAIPSEDLKKYQIAGKIAKEVREEIKKTVKEGMQIIDVCEKVENWTRIKGGKIWVKLVKEKKKMNMAL